MGESWDIDRFPLRKVGTFDPKKPVDPAWHTRPPAPLLRSGDEGSFLNYEDEDKIDLGGQGQHPTPDHQGVDEYIYIPPYVYEDVLPEEGIEREAASKKKPKPKKPRTPEEVWYDVHKHPEGVAGGTGKSPEHHLKRRGWLPQTINESSGRKTIQYMHPDYPGFAIQFGGATGTKPDHNFKVIDLVNSHTPLKQNFTGVAEAMNAVEGLSALKPGHMIMPMIHNTSWDIDRFPIGG